jgi:cell wall assembly regulator SMI1
MDIKCEKCGHGLKPTSKFCGSCGTRLIQATQNSLLVRLETSLKTIAPEFWKNRSRPGATSVEVRKFEERLGIKFPSLVTEFFLWRSFTDSGGHHGFGWPSPWAEWGYDFLGFEVTVGHYDFLCEMFAVDLDSPHGFEPGAPDFEPLPPGRWNVNWIPLFLLPSGADCACLDMAGLFDGAPGQMVEYLNESSYRNVTFSSFEEYLELFVSSMELGLWKPESELDAEPRDWKELHDFFRTKALSPIESFLVEPDPVRRFFPSPTTGGRLSHLEFTPDEHFNGSGPPVTEASAVKGKITKSSLTIEIFEIDGDAIRSLYLSVSDEKELRVGHPYRVATQVRLTGSNLSICDATRIGEDNRQNRRWQSSARTTGNATITWVDETLLELEFIFYNVEPNPGTDSGNARGTFSISARVDLALE